MEDIGKVKGSIKGYDFNDVTSLIIDTAIDVHNELGPGFMEATYQKALAKELEARGLCFGKEVDVPVYYKGEKIDTRRADFVVDNFIVEIKARSELRPEDYIQTISYLKASGYPIGLLINFGAQKAEFKRLVNTNSCRNKPYSSC